MKILKCFTILILMGCLIFLQACDKDDDNPVSEDILVGSLLPLTGSGASPGESGNEALTIAEEEINLFLANHFPQVHFKIKVEDTETDSIVAKTKYNVLKETGIRMIIGPFTSANLSALKPLADRDGILLISPASVAQSLAIANDFVYRLIPEVNTQGEALAALLVADSMQVLIPVFRDDVWGNELLEATSQYFEHEIMDPVRYDPSTTDFSQVITDLTRVVNSALANFPSDRVGIYLVSYGEGNDLIDLALNVNVLSQVRWYGNSAFAENKELVQNVAAVDFAESRKLSCPSFGLDADAAPKWEPLLTTLKTRLGRKPEIYAFTTYDAAWLATLTLLNLSEQNVDATDIADMFIFQANNYFGASGWTTLNEAGDRKHAIYDFWGVTTTSGSPEWTVVAHYNNGTGELVRE